MNEQTLNIKFVQEVEKYPCLYDYTIPEYSRKDITERAWSDVGKTFNLTQSQCKEKWKNLRAVFVRHVKPALSGAPSKSKKPYYLSDAMQFTIPYIRVLNNTSGNAPQTAFWEVSVKEYNDEENESKSIIQQNVPSPPSPTEDPAPSSACPPAKPTAPRIDTSSRRKRKPVSTDDDVIVESFYGKYEKKSDDVEDPKRMFLLSLLPDLRAMSDSQTRAFKRRVLALVDEILEESV